MTENELGAVLLLVAGVAGLLLIPLGHHGLWLIVLGIVTSSWLTEFRTLSARLVEGAIGLALVGEAAAAWIGFRFARGREGSTRSGWGALVVGLAGAIGGLLVSIPGAVMGSLVGAFLGAAVFEDSDARRSELLGRAAATAVKMAIAVLLVVLALFVVLRSMRLS